VAHGGLNRVVAAHLSKQNNTVELSSAALASALGTLPTDVLVADQEAGLDWQSVR
jgi:hypothetical protein